MRANRFAHGGTQPTALRRQQLRPKQIRRWRQRRFSHPESRVRPQHALSKAYGRDPGQRRRAVWDSCRSRHPRSLPESSTSASIGTTLSKSIRVEPTAEKPRSRSHSRAGASTASGENGPTQVRRTSRKTWLGRGAAPSRVNGATRCSSRAQVGSRAVASSSLRRPTSQARQGWPEMGLRKGSRQSGTPRFTAVSLLLGGRAKDHRSSDP